MDLLAKPAPLPGAERGAISLALDRPRILFFDMRATFLLHQKYGAGFILALYKVGKGKELELVSGEALAYFLWAALQRDALAHGEELTLEQVEAFIRPFTLTAIFVAVVRALSNSMDTPAPPGKIEAAAETPAAVAKKPGPVGPGATRVSTSMTRSASPTQSSRSRRNPSGR